MADVAAGADRGGTGIYPIPFTAPYRENPGEINELLVEAGEEALYYDDQIYRAAGLSPKALRDSEALQKIIKAGSDKTMRLFENLTSTTADTASRQFENALDAAYMDITSGAFSYQDAVRSAVKGLSKAGIDAIIYPSGHTDKMDVAVRRAVLTGVNQTAARIQTARADEMECDLVETTAHMGARPEHMDWQGRIFSRSGKSRKYPDFVKSTGYGTGPGLCGWNCRHSFFPYFEGLSERAYSRAKLREYENKTVTYNGRTLPYYDATQQSKDTWSDRSGGGNGNIWRWTRLFWTHRRPAPSWLPGGRSKRTF